MHPDAVEVAAGPDPGFLEGEGNEELCPGWHCQSGPEKAPLLTAALDSCRSQI